MTRTTAGKSTRPSPTRKKTEASRLTQRYARTVLKPLGRKEVASAIEQALEAVLSNENLRRDRVRVYGPFLRIEKPKRRGGPPRRLIWVRLRDRDRGVVHEVSVQADKVVDHVVDSDANPSFSDEERADARGLIVNHPELGRVMARKDVEIEWFSPGAHGRGRVIGARLVRTNHHRVIEQIAEAEVELDACVLQERRAPR